LLRDADEFAKFLAEQNRSGPAYNLFASAIESSFKTKKSKVAKLLDANSVDPGRVQNPPNFFRSGAVLKKSFFFRENLLKKEHE